MSRSVMIYHSKFIQSFYPCFILQCLISSQDYMLGICSSSSTILLSLLFKYKALRCIQDQIVVTLHIIYVPNLVTKSDWKKIYLNYIIQSKQSYRLWDYVMFSEGRRRFRKTTEAIGKPMRMVIKTAITNLQLIKYWNLFFKFQLKLVICWNFILKFHLHNFQFHVFRMKKMNKESLKL